MRRITLEAHISKSVSIHASVKDATAFFTLLSHKTKVSIHASVKDATFLELDIVLFIHVSIHASVKDATFDDNLLIIISLFQSTHL